MRQLVFLGTAQGMPIASSCSSILVEDDTTTLLLDTGGGHDILVNFTKMGKSPTEVQHIFISHYDSDHILGFVPLVRAIHRWSPRPQRPVKIFCSTAVHEAILSLFRHVAHQHFEGAKQLLEFIIVKEGTQANMNGWNVTFFDLESKKSPQMGCRIEFPDAHILVFSGDEPVKEQYAQYVKNADTLIHEAYCLESEKEIHKPYEKSHGTAADAARIAQRYGIKNLVLFHMEDKTLATRKLRYAEEVRREFNGEIFVPIDLDTFGF